MQMKLLLICCLSVCCSLCSAQVLRSFGSIPEDLRASSVTLFLEGSCDDRIVPATFEALARNGYALMLDGERRPTFGGLVTTVTVSDTTFTRKAKNAVVRSIHENAPTPLVMVIRGSFTFTGIRRVFVNIIERETGQLLQTISCLQRSPNIGYDRYRDELAEILAQSIVR